MLQRGEQLGLLPIAGQLPRIGQELLMHLLDGHLAPQFAVAGAIDRGEVARGYRVHKFVTGRRVHQFVPRISASAGECFYRDSLLPNASNSHREYHCGDRRRQHGENRELLLQHPPCRKASGKAGIASYASGYG